MQVAILSEGYQLYLDAPEGCVRWFQDHIKIPYDAARDGTVADWAMDSVSVGFTKPAGVAARYGIPGTTSRSSLVGASMHPTPTM